MNWFRRILLAGLACSFSLSPIARAENKPRFIPSPLPTHPGNIFVAGEQVVISQPPGEGEAWMMKNYEDNVIAKGTIKDGKIDLGQLPVGYYKIVRGAPGLITNRTYVGVLERLQAPTPATSPISIDVAMAWFFPQKEKMEEVTRLCELAGINRVRDRLLWGELEPERGKFVPSTRYDVSAQVQSDAGLKILQVCHVSAPWANTNTMRFPHDLRDIYNFYKELAHRWRNEIEAFEPWNEAEISVFGGHTGSEMASLQKAAYLGLKAGNPNVTACMNVFAIHRLTTLSDFQDNEASAYFDTYNLHHYEQLENYPRLYADHRAVSGGRPMWVSECSVHVKWRGDEKYKELTEADLRLQSERLTKTYAMSIHEGAEATFYFVLPHYTEHQLQYGLLRPDLTPRPGYVTLAAVGRFLADAKPLGCLKTNDSTVKGYLFDAKPDGKRAKVLVLWSDKDASFTLPTSPRDCFDHVGRHQTLESNTLKLTRAPLYVIFDKDPNLDLVAPPKPAKFVDGKPGNIVMQALLPESEIALDQSAYKFGTNATKNVSVFFYNFGEKAQQGKLKLHVPKNWSADFPTTVEVAPGERKELILKLIGADLSDAGEKVRISGSFGREHPVLSFRFVKGS